MRQKVWTPHPQPPPPRPCLTSSGQQPVYWAKSRANQQHRPVYQWQRRERGGGGEGWGDRERKGDWLVRCTACDPSVLSSWRSASLPTNWPVGSKVEQERNAHYQPHRAPRRNGLAQNMSSSPVCFLSNKAHKLILLSLKILILSQWFSRHHTKEEQVLNFHTENIYELSNYLKFKHLLFQFLYILNISHLEWSCYLVTSTKLI